MKKSSALLALAFMFFFNPSANAANDQFLFAGFAFSGNYDNRLQLYPYSSSISEEKNGDRPVLDKSLIDKFKLRPNEAKKIDVNLGKLGVGSQISLAFSLVQENIEVQEVEGKSILIVLLNSNILAFSKESNSVVASYPVKIRYTSAFDNKPSESQIKDIIRKLYLTNDLGINVFDVWLDRFSKIIIKEKYSKYIKVVSINVEPNAANEIATAGKNLSALQNQIANSVESAISYANDIPVVPNSIGEAIGAKMACRFSNGDSFQFNLPIPDYEITFTLRDFKSKTVEESSSYQDIFRVMASFRIKQPDLNKVYLDENIFNTLFVVRPKNAGVKINTWDQYYKTLNELIGSTSKQFSTLDGKWLEENASRGKEAKSSFKDAAKLFDSLK